MKYMFVVVMCAACSTLQAGGELSGKRVDPVPAPRITTIVSSNQSFLSRAGSYIRNVAYDLGDVVVETGDAVVGLVGFDISNDNNR